MRPFCCPGPAATRARTLVGNGPDATIVKTPAGRISFWSQGAEALYGWKREEVLGRSISEVLQTRAVGEARDVDALALAAGGWHGELIHRTRDGRAIVVESRWQVRHDADGAAVEVLESNIDVDTRWRESFASSRRVGGPSSWPSPAGARRTTAPRARQHGFDAHLTKPADPDEVRRLVSSVARRVETEQDGASGPGLAPVR